MTQTPTTRIIDRLEREVTLTKKALSRRTVANSELRRQIKELEQYKRVAIVHLHMEACHNCRHVKVHGYPCGQCNYMEQRE